MTSVAMDPNSNHEDQDVLESGSDRSENNHPSPVTVNPMQIYSDYRAQKQAAEEIKAKKRKKKKKQHEDSDWNIISCEAPNSILNLHQQPLLIDQTRMRRGDSIPEFMFRSQYEDSGFFFGIKRNLTMGCVMKPSDMDGHILIVGGPGSHKTSALIVPTLKTWRGITIAVDIKPEKLLRRQWDRFNRHTGKRIKVFSPAQEYGCAYDPYAFLRDDGEENLIHNVRELALALLAMPPETKDPIWRKGAQSILTAAILYYFDLGATFTETMTGLQFSTMDELFADIAESDNLAAQMYIKRVQGVKSKTAESSAMDLSDLISFTTDPLIRAAFSCDGPGGVFDWSYLNTTVEPFDLILEIPEDKLE